MSDTDCPVCGNRGRLATNYSLDWYACTGCNEKYEVDHTTCSVSGCASWVDEEDSGLCWFHYSQSNPMPDTFADYLKERDEQPRHDASPAPESTRAINPRFLDEIDGQAPRMPHEHPAIGQGEHHPAKEDPTCNQCGMPQQQRVHDTDTDDRNPDDTTEQDTEEPMPGEGWECQNPDCKPPLQFSRKRSCAWPDCEEDNHIEEGQAYCSWHEPYQYQEYKPAGFEGSIDE